MGETVQAKEAFIYWRNGISFTVREGDVLAADDPAVKGRRHRFEPVEPAVKDRRKRSQQPTMEADITAVEPSPDEPPVTGIADGE